MLTTVDGKTIGTDKSDYVKKLELDLHPRTFKMIVRVVDEAIEGSLGVGNITWCSTGSLFGYNSSRPKKDVDRLWDNVIVAMSDDIVIKKTMGSLLAWRISLRGENWIVNYTPTGHYDMVTGKEIHRSEFFISKVIAKPKGRALDCESLLSKYR